jgi:repressor LexA
MSFELTLKQQKALEYFEREILNKGKMPSLREAAADLKISHTSVAQFIRTLESKGLLKRGGKYSRKIEFLNRDRESDSGYSLRRVPVIGKINAGLPLYAQQKWDGTVIVDSSIYTAQNLFALRVTGDSMKDAGILDGDLVICEPRQFAQDGEIVVALIHNEEATVKRCFLHKDCIELRPENEKYQAVRYGFGDILIQGKVIGLQRGPGQFG